MPLQYSSPRATPYWRRLGLKSNEVKQVLSLTSIFWIGREGKSTLNRNASLTRTKTRLAETHITAL